MTYPSDMSEGMHVLLVAVIVQAVAWGLAWAAVLGITGSTRRDFLRGCHAAVGFSLWVVLRLLATTRPMITARGPDGTPIFHRWFLTSRPFGGSTGTPGWYLHHLTAPDYDPEEHNHPWERAETRVLRGGYTESRSGIRRARLPGDCAGFSGSTFHRITSVLPNTWTLFYAGPKHGRGWGFADGRKARDPNGKQAPARTCYACGWREGDARGTYAAHLCGRCDVCGRAYLLPGSS